MLSFNPNFLQLRHWEDDASEGFKAWQEWIFSSGKLGINLQKTAAVQSGLPGSLSKQIPATDVNLVNLFLLLVGFFLGRDKQKLVGGFKRFFDKIWSSNWLISPILGVKTKKNETTTQKNLQSPWLPVEVPSYDFYVWWFHHPHLSRTTFAHYVCVGKMAISWGMLITAQKITNQCFLGKLMVN